MSSDYMDKRENGAFYVKRFMQKKKESWLYNAKKSTQSKQVLNRSCHIQSKADHPMLSQNGHFVSTFPHQQNLKSSTCITK